MSLINRMLRDLDERRASTAERAGVSAQVRALPAPRRFPWGRLLSVLSGAAIGAAALWFLLDAGSVPPPAVPAASLPAATPTGAPEPPALAMPALVVSLPTDDAAEGTTAPTETLRLAVSLSALPSPRPEAAKAVESPPPVRARPPAAGAEGMAGIDKRPHAADSADGEYRKAMAAVRQGLAAEALAGLQAALRLDARHLSARQALLSLLVDQRRWPEAQALLVEGLALDPPQTAWIMALARLQVEQGQMAEAEETLARHARHGERNPDYQAFHALLLQKARRPKEAAERYGAALALRPGEGRWWYGLGIALEADQRPQEAREAFLKARQAGNLPPELATAADQHLR